MAVIFGTNADNTLAGGAGDDTISGFGGIDTVVFTGVSSDYRFDTVNGYLVVTDINLADGDDGSDRLTGIESLWFLDRRIGVAPPGEFRVNTTTAADQNGAAALRLADGGYVLTWQSFGQDGDQNGVYGQRYDAGGAARGGEFRLNDLTTSAQQGAAGAGLAAGGFVSAWESWDPDTANWNIIARRFDSDGTPQPGEFRVNATLASDQRTPTLTALADGGFVIAWESWAQDGGGWGVYAQRYDAQGNAQGNETRLNATTGDDQLAAALAGLAGGGYVATWVSWNQDGDVAGVYGQRYNAQGVAQGGEFRVNTHTAGWQIDPAVAALAGGGFVVTWQSTEAGAPGGYEIFGQRYDANGVAKGGEFLVNSTTAGDQYGAAVAGLGDGGFVVAWASADGNDYGVFAQRFGADGAALGAETRINVTIEGRQQAPSIAALADGGFVVSWESAGQDGSGTAVYAERFDASGLPAPAVLSGTAAGDSFDLCGPGNVAAAGGVGNDTYSVNGNGDRIYENAGEGNDLVLAAIDWQLGANLEDLTLSGAAVEGRGNELANALTGNAGANRLFGAAGGDSLFGGAGDDELNGGSGADWLTGDAGSDRFVFDTLPAAAGDSDTITDFRRGSDRIVLDDDAFTAFDATVSASLAAGQYWQGPRATAAHDADDRLVFNTRTGVLYYDADGIGGVDAVQIAVVKTGNHAGLSAADFLIVG